MEVLTHERRWDRKGERNEDADKLDFNVEVEQIWKGKGRRGLPSTPSPFHRSLLSRDSMVTGYPPAERRSVVLRRLPALLWHLSM